MNQLVNLRPQIEVIYDWMASGLIHFRRNCDLCNSEMQIKHSLYETKYNYFWICCFCYREKHINYGSPMAGLNIRNFD